MICSLKVILRISGKQSVSCFCTHMWLHHISSRLISLYFANVIDASRENQEKSQGTYFLMKPSRLFIIAVSLCCQLKTPFNDDAASNLITQNFVFTICGVHSLMGQMEYIDSPNFWSSLEEHEQGRFLKAFQLLDSRKGRSVYFSLTSGDQKDHNHSKDIRYLILSYLLKRLGKIALQKDAIQMKFPEYTSLNTKFPEFNKVATVLLVAKEHSVIGIPPWRLILKAPSLFSKINSSEWLAIGIP